jgi:hypothetical protein
LQIGWWFWTLQSALKPHEPTHGSWHLWLKQARFDGHSELLEHSGRQFGGAPNIPGTHEHTERSFWTLQWLLGPHGDGTHGFLGGSRAIRIKSTIFKKMFKLEKKARETYV